MEGKFTSGDLARATGQTLRTVRFYEEQGLLAPADPADGRHRRFDDDDLERLELIVDLRDLGLSLQDIRNLLALRSGCRGGDEFRARLRTALPAHIDQARARIARLRRLAGELRQALTSLDEPARDAKPCDCPAVAPESEATPRIVRIIAKGSDCLRVGGAGGRGGQGSPVNLSRHDPHARPVS